MEIIALVLTIISIVLVITLLVETRSYTNHQKEISRYSEYAQRYSEAAEQFVVGFETLKSTINFNADVQREVVDKINFHNRSIASVMAILEIHDRALNLNVVDDISQAVDELILPPNKAE